MSVLHDHVSYYVYVRSALDICTSKHIIRQSKDVRYL